LIYIWDSFFNVVFQFTRKDLDNFDKLNIPDREKSKLLCQAGSSSLNFEMEYITKNEDLDFLFKFIDFKNR